MAATDTPSFLVFTSQPSSPHHEQAALDELRKHRNSSIACQQDASHAAIDTAVQAPSPVYTYKQQLSLIRDT